ncbi:NADH-quinone oxidoreductase subunit C [Sulfurovum sp.]|uniref:NADH-quinone oxidoreductase subunit D-related protein n=1 Tax=Sulfurovum sp. TaxID=1969726 RepID=UPI0025F37430|nr:NADH-quinone oxidoreductase subunit C [Sulfurovum sp.]
MEAIRKLLENFDMEYVEDYKKIWVKAKLKSSKDLAEVAKAIKEEGLRSISTVSPTDFPDRNAIEMNYFFEDLETKRNLWLKCDIPREVEQCEIESVTPIFPSAEWHEREAFSMFGVSFLNHPDLRPIIVSEDFVGKTPYRRDFDWDAHEKDVTRNVQTIVDAFKKEQETNEINLDTDSSETVLNWGPTHPASGPIRLRIHTDGEEIIHIDPDIGYVWRALEHLVTKKDFIGAIVAVERLCFMDNINSMVGYCMAVEEIAETEITAFAKWMRVVLGEVARISSHMMGMGGFFNNLGLHTLAMWNMDIREYFLDFLESYSGARIATAAIEPGGVRYGLDMAMFDELQKAIEKFDAGIGDIDVIFAKNPTMRVRAKEVGILSADDIHEYGLSGIVARASGVKTDIRLDEPYAAYDQVEMDYVTTTEGTAADRFTILFRELKQSVEILKQAKKHIEEGVASGLFKPTKDHMVKVPKKLPAGEAVSRVEWARGEVLMHLVTQEKAKSPYRLKMRAPSFNHTMMLNKLLEGKTLSDVPLVFGSLYVCQGDLDR